MFNKWKDQLNEKFKKKAADDEATSDSASNLGAPNGQPQAQQVTFSLSNMD